MIYTKQTTHSEELLAADYPPLVYCEIDGDSVVRQVEVFQDGRVLKESLERMAGRVFGSLRDSAPLPEYNRDGVPWRVDLSTKAEFDAAWAKGSFLD
jgi:hypothetical protein